MFGQQQQQQPQQGLQPQPTAGGFGPFGAPQAQVSAFNPGSLGSIPQSTPVSSFQSTPGLMSPQAAPVQQPMATGTNPFRQSMLPAQPTGMPNTITSPVGGTAASPNRQSTNPFARHATMQQQQQSASPLVPAPTGTNPFAKGFGGGAAAQRPAATGTMQGSQQQPQPSLAPQATGTNPFRQGAFVNHQTGMGWQHNHGAIGGGLDGLETVPVFPRPAQQTPWQG